MKKNLLLLSIAAITCSNTFSQMKGNEMYGNANYNQYYGYNNYYQNVAQYYQTNLPTDSTYFIQAKILMNVLPDEFVATIAVHQESPTVKECNTKINERIDNFKKSLVTLGIKSEDIYVDMVA